MAESGLARIEAKGNTHGRRHRIIVPLNTTMVGTNRRRGQAVNMPDFLDNLNEVAAVGEASPEDNGTTLDEELAIFTNTSFIDWDAKHPSFSLESLDEPSAPSASAPMAEPASATTEVGDLTSFDFGTGQSPLGFALWTSSHSRTVA